MRDQPIAERDEGKPSKRPRTQKLAEASSKGKSKGDNDLSSSKDNAKAKHDPLSLKMVPLPLPTLQLPSFALHSSRVPPLSATPSLAGSSARDPAFPSFDGAVSVVDALNIALYHVRAIKRSRESQGQNTGLLNAAELTIGAASKASAQAGLDQPAGDDDKHELGKAFSALLGLRLS
jgi:hypothetical protein